MPFATASATARRLFATPLHATMAMSALRLVRTLVDAGHARWRPVWRVGRRRITLRLVWHVLDNLFDHQRFLMRRWGANGQWNGMRVLWRDWTAANHYYDSGRDNASCRG